MKALPTIGLSASDWEEIYAALEYKATRIREGAYRPCLEHGRSCTACDIAWASQLERICAAIGPDGQDAHERGVIGL